MFFAAASFSITENSNYLYSIVFISYNYKLKNNNKFQQSSYHYLKNIHESIFPVFLNYILMNFNKIVVKNLIIGAYMI